ncbi:MAG: SLC13 family permease [Xanthomonadales bacterium]|nr:SLC13 family permease [Xanthomonadales bacterium]
MSTLSKETLIKRLLGAIIFLGVGFSLTGAVPTIEIAWVSSILLFTIYLFVFEIVEVDVAAICIMVLLGLTSLIGPMFGIEQPFVPAQHLFDGFASNAVISIVAVMIIGKGLDKTGVMNVVAGAILKHGGTTEKRIIPLISTTVAIISSFMQNVGAAALFLPVVSRISARSGLPLSRLLMPMGFCAILGGTVSMVGSSPLILLNDLMMTSNQALPPGQKMSAFHLFSVAPVGIALVATGVIYFVLFGRFVLPSTKSESNTVGSNTMSYFQDIYGIDYALFEVVVPADSSLVGLMLDDVEGSSHIRVIATHRKGKDTRVGPGALARDLGIEAGMVMGILASPHDVDLFVAKYGLQKHPYVQDFGEVLASTRSGVAEVVIPPGSQLIGKSARDVWMRKTYGLAMVGLHRRGETLREGDDIRNLPLEAGDTLVVHTTWDALARLEKNRDFVVVTSEYPHEETRPQKVGYALFFFLVALSLVLFSDLRLSISLLTGALGMVLSGVMNIDEAYEAVSWKTVFLLASLIPLGMAVENTGTAAWIAQQTLALLGDVPIWVLQTALAVLATFFTLVMSNVGATVLLVPLAVNLAIGAGADPAVFALTVAIATSNSFLIPTHQVNALLMGPGGYRVPDFMRAGGIMTILFLIVMMIMMNLVF